MNGRWLAWPLKAGWENDERNIGWAEFIAVELAVLALIASGARSVTFVIHPDNKGIVGAFDASFSRSREQNMVLRRLLCLLYDNNLDKSHLGPFGEEPGGRPLQRGFPS
jgi:hypothetical protein